ncbi:hypothetical protein BDV96DRAFT_640725 [Lophiotrema nucula]|uniref:Uncharacterized protein n=1 Tax=Lophiotrema nucula TaxID=690887 RepID=A0A6A5ZNR1_9PLEO|nr:hypothetical protein BDV96DRAFT_640725 [Lophiotrema nucula]
MHMVLDTLIITLAGGGQVPILHDENFNQNDDEDDAQESAHLDPQYSFINSGLPTAIPSKLPPLTNLPTIDLPKTHTTTATAPPTSTAQPANGGDLYCRNDRDDQGNPEFGMTPDSMHVARDQYCDWMVSMRFIVGTIADSSSNLSWSDHLDDPISIETYIGDNNGCPTLDFSKTPHIARGVCKDRLDEVINGCNTEPNGKKYWKLGGMYKRDCV